jgi:hypothetical protein
MLVASRLAGLSALETCYGGVKAFTQIWYGPVWGRDSRAEGGRQETRPGPAESALDRVSAMPRVQRPTGGPEARLALFPARRDRDRLRPSCGLGRAHRFDHRS